VRKSIGRVNVEKHNDARVAGRRFVVASATLVQAEWVPRARRRRRNDKKQP
jgi:hypothetical protein